MAHKTIRKYVLRSASFSAIGVAVSPGRSVNAADAAVEAAVSSITVDFLSSNDAMVFAWKSLDVEILVSTSIEISARIKGSTIRSILLLSCIFILFESLLFFISFIGFSSGFRIFFLSILPVLCIFSSQSPDQLNFW